MALCKLCRYRLPLDTGPLVQCPVCGEAYDVYCDKWGRTSQQELNRGGSPIALCHTAQKVLPSTCFNQKLQSLLQLVPEQQNRRKQAQDVVRVAGALTPTRGDEGQSESDVIYIRPRVDPTMRVLKGRYNTQPRVAKAISFRALHRLSHPLMGYDSMAALEPKARRQRQTSVEWLPGKGRGRRKSSDGGRSGQLFSKTSSSVELSRLPVSNTRLRRSFSGNTIVSAANRGRASRSLNTTHLQKKNATKSTKFPVSYASRRRGRESGDCKRPTSYEVNSKSRPVLVSIRSRDSGGRGARPALRRKRVATMRSVNGWVREADPASTRRQVLLGQLLATEKRGQNRKFTRSTNNNVQPSSDSERDSLGGGRTFLTTLGIENSSSMNTCLHQSVGDDDRGGETIHCDDDWREGENPGKLQPSRIKDGVSPALIQQVCQVRRPSRKESCAASIKNEKVVPGKGDFSSNERSRVTHSWDARERRVSTIDRNKHFTSVRGMHGIPEKVEVRRCVQELPGGDLISPPDQIPWSGKRSNNPDPEIEIPRNGCSGARSNNHKVWSVPWTRRVEEASMPMKVVPRVVTAWEKTHEHAVEARSPPAWGASRSHPSTPQGGGNRSKATSGLDTFIWASHPPSVWRDSVADPSSHAVELLQSFEGKVTMGVGLPVGEPCIAPSIAKEGINLHLLADDRQNRQFPRENSPHPEASLAMMDQRPSSKCWVPRRSLPSILVEQIPLSSSTSSAPAALTTAVRRRGKRLTGHVEPTGRMKRLDKNPVTVGDAWGNALEVKHRGRGVSTSTAIGVGVQPFSSLLVGSGTQAMEDIEMAKRASSRGGSGGELLLKIVPRPLLCVGGDTFRWKS